MNNIEYAVRLNNEAVSLLLTGNDHQAVECFTKSVSLMKRVLTRATSHGAPPSRIGQLSPVVLGGSIPQSAGPISPPAVDSNIFIHHASSPLPGLTDRHCYIYNQALTISTEGAFSSHIESYAQIYSAVVIFNMALAHHRGRRNGNRKCADRAVVLYNMIMRLLRCSGIGGTAGVVKLATINNLSQLRFEQGNYAQAREGLDYLSALIAQAESSRSSPIAPSPNGGVDDSHIATEDMRGLIMNVLFVKAPNVAPAA